MRYTNGLPFNRLQRTMDQFLASALRDFPVGIFQETGRVGHPAMNVWEKEGVFFLESELPGLAIEDLEITVDGSEVTLKGEKKSAPGENVTIHRQERGIGPFVRTLTFPVDLDASQVQAKLKDGVLTLTLPKAEQARPRKIPVLAN